MYKSSLKHKGSPRRHRVATARIGAIQPSFDPYAQCTCDLDNIYGGVPLPPEWFVPLYHENGTTSSHLPECPQLRTVHAKTSRKRKSSARPASYLDLEEEEEEEEEERKKPKVAKRKRVRDASARTDTIKAFKPIFNPYAKCCCDLLSYPEYQAYCEVEGDVCEKEATVRRTHTNGSTSFHAPSCITDQTDSSVIRKPYISPPKSLRYIDLEEKEQTTDLRKKKKKHTWRQPREATSAAYIDSEGEEEKGEDGPASPLARRYNSRTIASDFLRAIGEHPYLPPLNAHVDGLPTKKHGRASK